MTKAKTKPKPDVLVTFEDGTTAMVKFSLGAVILNERYWRMRPPTEDEPFTVVTGNVMESLARTCWYAMDKPGFEADNTDDKSARQVREDLAFEAWMVTVDSIVDAPTES